MKADSSPAEVNIHLRARAYDKNLIDQAAALVGSNRSQFMMSAALKEAKNLLLDQTTIYLNNEQFQKMLDWMDSPPTPEEAEGIKRLLSIKTPWD